MKVNDLGIEGLTLIFHLIVSLVLIISYVWLAARGLDNETLKFAVVGVIGYWFGVTGKSVLGKNKNKDDKQ